MESARQTTSNFLFFLILNLDMLLGVQRQESLFDKQKELP